MSPRAAWQFESLGFEHVYDHATGEAETGWRADSRATGPPQQTRADDLLRSDVPTCGIEERVGSVRERVDRSGYDFCPVVNDTNVLFGRLRRVALEGDPEARAGEVMEAGPSTVRPSRSLRDLLSSGRTLSSSSRLLTGVCSECSNAQRQNVCTSETKRERRGDHAGCRCNPTRGAAAGGASALTSRALERTHLPEVEELTAEWRPAHAELPG